MTDFGCSPEGAVLPSPANKRYGRRWTGVITWERLGVPGETLWRVPSLSLPDARRFLPPEDLVLYEAVRLFVDRAVASEPQFAVTSRNAPAVAQVCQRLDGIPLTVDGATPSSRAALQRNVRTYFAAGVEGKATDDQAPSAHLVAVLDGLPKASTDQERMPLRRSPPPQLSHF